MATLDLPRNGAIETYTTTGTPVPLAKRNAADFPRIAYGAAHVVADPLADNDPWLTPAIDWERTLAFRHRLWDLGLGVAEAMDTAQRGMGLGWPEAQELIRRALAEAKGRPGALIACGAGTDHLAPWPGRDHRRRAPRLRGADRDGRGRRRPHHPDGEPRARRRREVARRLPARSTTASSAR